MPYSIALCLAVSVAAYGAGPEYPQHDWLLVPGVRAGAITPESSEESLSELFGPANVRPETIDVGEGMTEPGTILFPNDPAGRIEILWSDVEARRHPHTVWISGSESRWHFVHGISLGMTLEKLEAINGNAFEMAGWGWDYGGTIYDWRGGVLATDLLIGQDVWIRLVVEDWQGMTQADQQSILGDGAFLSSMDLARKLNPSVQYAAIAIHE